jgi:hypothetical protein
VLAGAETGSGAGETNRHVMAQVIIAPLPPVGHSQ